MYDNNINNSLGYVYLLYTLTKYIPILIYIFHTILDNIYECN